MKCCINGENIIRLLCLTAKLLKFEIQKCGQILCAHKPYFLMPGHILVYVIAWVAVVFGINCASNAGRKLVIVRGAAEHYYCFLPTLREQLIQNTTANHAIIN